jgi:hypothetical protein
MSEKIKDTIIVVGVTETDGFGNLFVTPQGGGDKIKIGVKRQHLYPLFEQGRAVMLHWEIYMNKPYVADAKLVEGELPPPVKPEVPQEYPDKEQIPKTKGEFSPQEVGMWWKHKAFSLSYSKDLACSGQIEVKDIYKYAEEMLAWLNKPMV